MKIGSTLALLEEPRHCKRPDFTAEHVSKLSSCRPLYFCEPNCSTFRRLAMCFEHRPKILGREAVWIAVHLVCLKSKNALETWRNTGLCVLKASSCDYTAFIEGRQEIAVKLHSIHAWLKGPTPNFGQVELHSSFAPNWHVSATSLSWETSLR